MKKNTSILMVIVLLIIVSIFSGCSGQSPADPVITPVPTLSPDEISALEAEKEKTALALFTDKFYNQYSNENFDAKNIVMTMAVLSDLHIGIPNQAEKTEKAIDFLKRRTPNGIDVVLLNGDLTNNYRSTGDITQITTVRDLFVNNLPETTKFFYSLGIIHDAGGLITKTTDTKKIRETFASTLGDRFMPTETQLQDISDKGYRHSIINGYHFISVDMNVSDYSQDALKWLDNTLTEITQAEPNKAVFVMTHVPDIASMTKILNKYPQVIYFSGHEHIPFNTPSGIHQNRHTALSIGGLAYYREDNVDSLSSEDNNNNYEYGQGFIVEIDNAGNVRVLRADLYNQVILNENWVIPSPKSDKSHINIYTALNKRKHANAEFPQDAKILIEVDENNPFAPVKITFPAATASDGQPIKYYVVTVKATECSGTIIETTKTISSLYMKYPNQENMPTSYSITVDGVAAPNSYTVTVKAYNCMNKASQSLTQTYTSEGFTDVL